MRSVEDYEGWDAGMMQRASFLEQDLQKLLKGGKVDKSMDAVDLRKEPKLNSHIADLQGRVKKLYSTATSQVDSYATTGNLQLRGEGTLGAISDATDAVGDQAKLLAEGAAAAMLDAALAARKKIGLAPKEPVGILERVQRGVQDATKSAVSAVGATPSAKSAGNFVDSATSLAASAVGYKTEPDSYIEILGDNAQGAMDAAASSAAGVGKTAGEAYEAVAKGAGDAFEAATTSAGNVYKAASSAASDAIPSSIAGGEAARFIVDAAQEQFASVSHSASKVVESAGASGFSIVDQASSKVVATGSKGVDQGAHSVQGMYDAVKEGVESAGEALGRGSEAVVDAMTGEDSKLVGKMPDDKDFNTVGKAAEAVKDRIVHAEL